MPKTLPKISSKGWLPETLLPVWLGFLLLSFLMLLGRFVFLLSPFIDLDPQHWKLYVEAFSVGLRLDLVIAAYFMLPLFLLSWLHNIRRIRNAIVYLSQVYLIISASILALLTIIDLYFFEEFNSHMNLLVLQENVLRPESLSFLWDQYPVVGIVITLVLVAWITWKLTLRMRKHMFGRRSPLLTQLATGFASMVVLALALRGGWQERPIDWGHAMFSDHHTANQLALNGIFLLGRSAVQLSSEQTIRQHLAQRSETAALQKTRALIIGQNESFVSDSGLERELLAPESITPNIVLVVLESHLGSLCGYINPSEAEVTPVLDSLAHSGIAFTHCFANGNRSAFGISSILMSWPVLPGLPLISQMEATRGAPCLASYLGDIGYRNIFLYGGDSQFDNMEGFALANGYDEVIDEDELSQSPGTMWGIYDHLVFDEALELLDSSSSPLQLTLFTTSNHQPWTVPTDYESKVPAYRDRSFREGAVHRTMSYVDLVLGEFMEKASSRTWFDNTLFVFIADHGLTRYREQFEDIRNSHIPWVIYGPELIKTPQILPQVVSQVDVLPTLLGVIGFPLPYVAMGRDVLSNSEGYAPRISNDYFTWFEGHTLYGELMGQSTNLHEVSSLYPLEQRSLSSNDSLVAHFQARQGNYLQVAYSQFKRFGK